MNRHENNIAALLKNRTARQASREERRRKKTAAARLAASAFFLAVLLTALLWVLVTPVAGEEVPPALPVIPPDIQAPPEPPEEPEDFENEKIEAALLARANVIENCTVTWYTADTCGKTPDHPAYGVTASGQPVVEHLTCATDPRVIPLYSDVFVEYADGTIEQFWATDTGVTGNAVDIYTPDYEYAIRCGRQSLTVWWVEPCEMEMK